MPRIVENYIREIRFLGSNKAYFILTCGTETNNAVRYIKKLCNEKGFAFGGFAIEKNFSADTKLFPNTPMSVLLTPFRYFHKCIYMSVAKSER
jgi:hypothetical protein